LERLALTRKKVNPEGRLIVEQFVYFIRPVRDHFINTMTQEEEETMERHFNYLQNLLAEDQLVLAGPCLDGAVGIVVFQAESENQARLIMENDPSVREGIMEAELHPYRVSLMKG
jgi:uncharacterized protein YciI